jgi:hypothetical protein
LPSIERRLCEFPENLPKSRCRVAGLGHDQGRAGRLAICRFRRVHNRRPALLWTRRSEDDRSGSVGCRLTKKRSGEIARKRKQTVRTARKGDREGKSRMGRIAGQVPASRVNRRCCSRANISIAGLDYPYAFHDEYTHALCRSSKSMNAMNAVRCTRLLTFATRGPLARRKLRAPASCRSTENAAS